MHCRFIKRNLKFTFTVLLKVKKKQERVLEREVITSCFPTLLANITHSSVY